MNKLNTGLYFITDSNGFSEEEFLKRVEEGIMGGADILQLREKDKTTREYIELAIKVHKICREKNIPLIIDDRVDVALAAECEGVHLGQSDMPAFMARKILGKDKIIGVTAKTVEKAKEAVLDGADYLGVGAIYPTTTKVKTVLTPVETLCEIKKAVNIPVFAIGGLNITNVDILKQSGIDGICAVSAIMKAENVQLAAKELKEWAVKNL